MRKMRMYRTELIFFFVLFSVLMEHTYGKNIYEIHDEVIKESVVDGKTALIKDHPYTVKLRGRLLYMLYNTEVVENSHAGSGVIISEKHILTAAHLFEEEKKAFDQSPIFLRYEFQICSGFDGTDYTINGPAECAGEKLMVHDVDYIILHPEYHQIGDLHYNDIAVITLAVSMTFDDYRKSISLPETEVPGFSQAVLIGFGKLNHETDSPTLQKATFVVLPSKFCNITSFSGTMEFSQLCVSAREGVSAACYGDSGGPLVFNNSVIGLVSASHTVEPQISCHSDYPDIYTSVFQQREFINWATGEDSKSSTLNIFGSYYSRTNVYVRFYGVDADLQFS